MQSINIATTFLRDESKRSKDRDKKIDDRNRDVDKE